MGERLQAQKTSRMCDMSGDVKKFVLASGNGEVSERFKVPVGHDLINDDEEKRKFAIQTIVYMLAHIGCIDLLEGGLPGASLRRAVDIEEVYSSPCIKCRDYAGMFFFARLRNF